MGENNNNIQAVSSSEESTVMSDHNNNSMQVAEASEESSTQISRTPSTSDSDSESESSDPGHANAPPPYQHPHNHHCDEPNHEDVHFHQWQCCCFSYHPPQTLNDYIQDCHSMDEEKVRLLAELYQVTQLLRASDINQGEFHAVLSEYAAIKHEMLKLDIRRYCVRRGSRFELASQMVFH
jgi:hypothetical protein